MTHLIQNTIIPQMAVFIAGSAVFPRNNLPGSLLTAIVVATLAQMGLRQILQQEPSNRLMGACKIVAGGVLTSAWNQFPPSMNIDRIDQQTLAVSSKKMTPYDGYLLCKMEIIKNYFYRHHICLQGLYPRHDRNFYKTHGILFAKMEMLSDFDHADRQVMAICSKHQTNSTLLLSPETDFLLRLQAKNLAHHCSGEMTKLSIKNFSFLEKIILIPVIKFFKTI